MSEAKENVRVALIVDDDHDMLEVTSRFLIRRGYEVHTAVTPIGAGTSAFEHRPNVMIIDLMMPALDGTTMATMFRSRGDDTPIVFYTSMAAEEAEKATREVPNSTVAYKKDGPGALLNTIEDLLRED